MRDGGVLFTSLLGCTLGVGPQGGDLAHSCGQNLGSWTLPSSFSFPCPHRAHLTPASDPHAETAYVLGNYKTEPCKKPPRLCRQGYACPYYHNSKDRRRSPRKHKYRCFGPSRPAVGGGWQATDQGQDCFHCAPGVGGREASPGGHRTPLQGRGMVRRAERYFAVK